MDGNGQDGYQQIIRITLSNGKHYAFRVYNDKGTYATSRTTVSGSVTGWGGWKALDSTAAAAMNGEGVDFKLERTSADTLTVTINGVVVDTYKMDGVTEADKVVSVGIQSNMNKGKYVEIPFEVANKVEETEYQFNTNEINQYNIVYDADNSDYLLIANQLSDQIFAKFRRAIC
jgi:hypothetical protein